MKLSRHKSLIREISPGVIQIGNSPFSPTLTLTELTGNIETSNAYIENISGVYLQYESAAFDTRPTVDGKEVLLEGDVETVGGLTEVINNTGELLENSIVDVSGVLQSLIDQEIQDREEADTILNNAIDQISGLLITEINQIELSLSGISGDIININDDIINANTSILELQNDLINISGDVTNISGVTYEEAENLAKKWSIIFG